MEHSNDEARPTLGLDERDRRWANLRQLMARLELDALIIAGFRGREQFDSYVTDDYGEGAVVFPAQGDPVALTWTTSRISRAWESERRGNYIWVQDWRVGATGTNVAAILTERGLADARLGLVGMSWRGPTETEGTVPARFWVELHEALPGVTLQDATRPYAELLLVKSAQELDLVRYAAEVSEQACQAMLDATRVGVGENVIYGEVMRAVYAGGGTPRYPGMNLHSGPDNASWGPPRWLTRAESIRTVQPGDMVQGEIMVAYGSMEIQVQMSIAMPPVAPQNARCAQAVGEMYAAGVAAVRPGMTFADVVASMEGPLREYDCWAKTPLVHSLSPIGWVGHSAISGPDAANSREGKIEKLAPGRRQVRGGDLVLVPGMTFALEPNACIGDYRVNIGASIIVTEDGCEVLNRLPGTVHVAA